MGKRFPDVLAMIFDGIPKGSTLNDFWEENVLHLSGRESTYFDDLLTVDDFRTLLTDRPFRREEIRFLKEGKDVTSSIIVKQKITLEEESIDELLKDGVSIVVSSLLLHNIKIRRACMVLRSSLSFPVQANAYLSPPRSRAFDAHWDPHDVIVAQIAGSKSWFVESSPTRELPLQRPDNYSVASDLFEATKPIRVSSGDTLYVPRGFAHRAETGPDLSLHVTFPVQSTNWVDILRIAFEQAVDQVPLCRSALPLGWQNHDELFEQIEALAIRVFSEMEIPLRVSDAIASAKKEL